MSEVITAINAKPETVSSFLENVEYVIPDYQRPYSWGKDECIKLWEDLITFYDERDEAENSPYFLGNVVIYNENRKRVVVDGQQRLITLNLLLRAFFTQCSTLRILERILYQTNAKTGDVEKPYQIKIEHSVLGDNENKKLEAAILNKDMESNYKDNYNELLRLAGERLDTLNANEIEEFILTLIHNVVLLPIECTDRDSALTIFETINNRGMDLSDDDIFKSKLYKYAAHDKDKFISRWNQLVDNVEKANISLKDVFANYMHVLRGKEKNTDSLIGLRKFYDEDSSKRLRDWMGVMDSLDKLVWAWGYIHDENSSASVEIINWARVLSWYPNVYWQYPIMTFLHNSIKRENNELAFTGDPDELLNLEKEVARYCYWKWLKYRGVNAVKDTIYKVVRDLSHDGDYGTTIQYDLGSEPAKSDKENASAFKNILKRDLGRGLKGICLLAVILNDHQTRVIPENFQIEHILPKQWEHYQYNDWDTRTFNLHHDTLGNLVPLEKNLNIKSSHRFFHQKQNYYRESAIQEVSEELSNLREWTPVECKERNDRIISRVIDFLLKSAPT